jgi:putative oxidoreductase
VIEQALQLAAHGFGWHDAALMVVRVGTGLFFALSGFNKLFNKERHAALVQTFYKDRVPLIPVMQWWVPIWEFIGGLLLIVGLFSAFAAFVLLIICCVACYCEAKERVDAYKPINGGDRVADYLYLPEVLYILLLLVNILAGTGTYSLDHWLLP